MVSRQNYRQTDIASYRGASKKVILNELNKLIIYIINKVGRFFFFILPYLILWHRFRLGITNLQKILPNFGRQSSYLQKQIRGISTKTKIIKFVEGGKEWNKSCREWIKLLFQFFLFWWILKYEGRVGLKNMHLLSLFLKILKNWSKLRFVGLTASFFHTQLGWCVIYVFTIIFVSLFNVYTYLRTIHICIHNYYKMIF